MTVMAFIPSKQFRLEQRVNQIDEQPGGYERSKQVVKNHDSISSQLLASVDIRDRHDEEADRERHHHDVHHGSAPETMRRRDAAAALNLIFFKCAGIVRPLTADYLTISP
jgi:hypothetical protein